MPGPRHRARGQRREFPGLQVVVVAAGQHAARVTVLRPVGGGPGRVDPASRAGRRGVPGRPLPGRGLPGLRGPGVGAPGPGLGRAVSPATVARVETAGLAGTAGLTEAAGLVEAAGLLETATLTETATLVGTATLVEAARVET